jgi:hypothetical protein
VNEEAFLQINTSNWEDSIIIDLNQAHISTSPNTNANLINERIKYAGWIPSNEHRTLISYQTKVLGKKLDNLNLYKEASASGGATSGASSKAKAAAAANQAAPANLWTSIFPNENNDLFASNWERKIIMDTENDLAAYEMSPPDFCLDPNDDNLIIGIPEDVQNAADDKNKEASAATTSITATDDKQRGDKAAKADQNLKQKQAGKK